MESVFETLTRRLMQEYPLDPLLQILLRSRHRVLASPVLLLFQRPQQKRLWLWQYPLPDESSLWWLLNRAFSRLLPPCQEVSWWEWEWWGTASQDEDEIHIFRWGILSLPVSMLLGDLGSSHFATLQPLINAAAAMACGDAVKQGWLWLLWELDPSEAEAQDSVTGAQRYLFWHWWLSLEGGPQPEFRLWAEGPCGRGYTHYIWLRDQQRRGQWPQQDWEQMWRYIREIRTRQCLYLVITWQLLSSGAALLLPDLRHLHRSDSDPGGPQETGQASWSQLELAPLPFTG